MTQRHYRIFDATWAVWYPANRLNQGGALRGCRNRTGFPLTREEDASSRWSSALLASSSAVPDSSHRSRCSLSQNDRAVITLINPLSRLRAYFSVCAPAAKRSTDWPKTLEKRERNFRIWDVSTQLLRHKQGRIPGRRCSTQCGRRPEGRWQCGDYYTGSGAGCSCGRRLTRWTD